jgi:hypothetical protein
VFYINLPFCAVGLVAVPIWLRYEKKGAPSDGAAVSGVVGQPYPAVGQQESSTSGEMTGRSDTPTVDWDGATLHEDAEEADGRTSPTNRDTSTRFAETRTKEAESGDRSYCTDPDASTLVDQKISKSVEIRHKLSSVDWLGSTLMIASSTSFLVGLSLGGNKYPWRDSAVLVPIVAGLIGIVITIMYEQRYTRNPFLRLAIYQHWSGIVVSICTILQGFIVSGSRTPHPRSHD